MKKCSCGAWINGNKCDDCGKEYQNENLNFNGTCLKCGRRARNVKGDKEKPEHWCYECWRIEDDKRFYHADRILSSTEHNYALAKKEYILKPQFYGKQPDYESYQKAADKFSAYELNSIGKN